MFGRWTRTLVSMLVLLGAAAPASAQSSTPPQPESSVSPPLSAFVGNYQISRGHIVGIDLYAEGGPFSLVYSDYRSGVIRRLTQTGDVFEAGPGFATAKPTDFTVRFVRDGGGP